MLSLAVGTLVAMCVYTIIIMKEVSLRGKAKLSIVSIYSMGIVLWPILWSTLLKENSNINVSYVSLVWPIIILLIELYLTKYHTFEQYINRSKSVLSLDANVICSLTFALSGILGAQKDPTCKNMLIYGVLGCVAFVLPTPETPSETIESIIIQHIQKVILTYSTALLLAGSMLLMRKEDNEKNVT